MNDRQSITRQDSAVELGEEKHDHQTVGFFSLPPETRTSIYELIFNPEESHELAFNRPGDTVDSLNHEYFASDLLAPLLTCRQFHTDANLLAFSRTTFVVRNPFTSRSIATRLLSILRKPQIQAIRAITFIAEADNFRQMRNWKGHAFGCADLQLDELGILLYRSSYWHYLSDFNTVVVQLLRDLKGVRKVTWIKNGSKVKPHFHTWFNRLVGVILKVDQFERFGRHLGAGGHSVPLDDQYAGVDGNPEKIWWTWEFNEGSQTAILRAVPPKNPNLRFEEYQAVMQPLREGLLKSMAMEAYDPDPMSRTGYA